MSHKVWGWFWFNGKYLQRIRKDFWLNIANVFISREIGNSSSPSCKRPRKSYAWRRWTSNARRWSWYAFSRTWTLKTLMEKKQFQTFIHTFFFFVFKKIVQKRFLKYHTNFAVIWSLNNKPRWKTGIVVVWYLFKSCDDPISIIGIIILHLTSKCWYWNFNLYTYF